MDRIILAELLHCSLHWCVTRSSGSTDLIALGSDDTLFVGLHHPAPPPENDSVDTGILDNESLDRGLYRPTFGGS